MCGDVSVISLEVWGEGGRLRDSSVRIDVSGLFRNTLLEILIFVSLNDVRSVYVRDLFSGCA